MNKRTITYLIIVFSISTLFYILVMQGGGLDGAGQLYVLPLMWTPAVAALITTGFFQRNLRGMGWRLGQPRFLIIGYLLPILYATIAYGAVWLLGLGGVNLGALGDRPGLSIVLHLTVFILGSLLLAVGEEIGWRGLLVPQLYREHSFVSTALISGVIWGLWHVPLIIGGGYSSGAPAPFAVTCFMIHVVGVSFAFAWLRLASGSLWPPALMHATHNTLIQSVYDVVTVDTGRTPYFTTEFGLALALTGIIVALIFWRIGVPASTPVQQVP